MPQSRDIQDSKAAQSGAELVRLIPALRAFARTFYREPNEADDLVQETLIKGLTNINRYEIGTSMKSWLFTIMRNTFYTKIKLASREAPGLTDCASVWPVIEAPQEWFSRTIELSLAVQRLPKQQREVLMLIGVLGVSYEEAAEICGCAKGTIKSRLNRARLRLLEELGETAEPAGRSVRADRRLTHKAIATGDRQRPPPAITSAHRGALRRRRLGAEAPA